MAEARQMPTDRLTGLPHAILPVEISSPRTDINYHHHFFYRRHPDLEGEVRLGAYNLNRIEDIPLDIIAGFAVRMSRGQRLPGGLHELAHQRYGAGPTLPHTVDEKFVTAVKACSGIVSRWALDVTAPDSKPFVYMKDDVFEQVAGARALGTEKFYYDRPANYRRKVLGSFFLRYAAEQDLSHLSDKVIDQFLYARDESRRRAMGNFILHEAMEVGLAPILPIHRVCQAKGMIQPGRPDVRSSVWKMVHPDSEARVFPLLRRRLAA